MELSLFADIVLHRAYFLPSISKRNIRFSGHAIAVFLAGNEKIILGGSTFSVAEGGKEKERNSSYNCFITFLLATLLENGNPDAYKPAGCSPAISG